MRDSLRPRAFRKRTSPLSGDGECGTHLVQIVPDHVDRLPTHRYEAFLPALSEYARQPRVKEQVGPAEVQQFGRAEAGGVHEFEDRPVAQP